MPSLWKAVLLSCIVGSLGKSTSQVQERYKALNDRKTSLLQELEGVVEKLDVAGVAPRAALKSRIDVRGETLATFLLIFMFVFIALVAVLADRQEHGSDKQEHGSHEHGRAERSSSASWGLSGADAGPRSQRLERSITSPGFTVADEEEHAEFNERLRAWEKDNQRQSSGVGFGAKYKNADQWRWRRTISYWIAITFFIGSLFFTFSSFMGCYAHALGSHKWSVTTGGYLAGKVNYLICCYLMCLECVNNMHCSKPGEAFYMNPFRYKTAIDKLHALGCGAWPYWASVLYFIGCLIFTVGFAAELSEEGIGEHLAKRVQMWAFLIGSILFTLGGVMECIENKVFVAPGFKKGSVGAVINTTGGIGFTLGSALAWVPPSKLPSTVFWQSFNFGWGSALFTVGSSVMIIMWKNEQFGLTFLACLNDLGGANGQPIIVANDSAGPQEKGFENVSVFFIHVYCLVTCVSTYNAIIELESFVVNPLGNYRHLQWAFNEFVPCCLAMIMLAMRSAVARVPQGSPYKQIFAAIRLLMVLVVVNSTVTFYQFMRDRIIG